VNEARYRDVHALNDAFHLAVFRMRQRLSCRIDQKLRVLGMLIVKPDIALILPKLLRPELLK